MKNNIYAVVCVRERELTILNQASNIEKAKEMLLKDFAETVGVTKDEVLNWKDGQPDSSCDYECGYKPHNAWANDVRHENYDWYIIEVTFSD